MVTLPTVGLVVIGGEADSKTRHSTVSTLRSLDQEWQLIPNLRIKVSRHCSVPVNSREILVIGGLLDDQPFSDKVIKIDFETFEAFTLTSRMKIGRQLHSCAVVDPKKIVVVGGRDYRGLVSSVEVFNVMTSTWTTPKYLELPQAIGYGQLIPVTGEIICLHGVLCSKSN